MTSNKEVAAYVMEQFSGLEGVRHIPMMGATSSITRTVFSAASTAEVT